jgi:hypothetical protein
MSSSFRQQGFHIARWLPYCLAISCIEPLPVKEIPYDRAFVVDGMITDSAPPYSVSLHYSSALGDESDREDIHSASVLLLDSDGNQELLTYTANGVYQTNGEIVGTVGKSYALKITTEKGHVYESPFQEMKNAGAVDDLRIVFEPGSISFNNVSLPNDAFGVYINAAFNNESTDYVRWRSTGVWHIETFPQEHQAPFEGRLVPSPLPCSGYVYQERTTQLVQEGPCDCCHCWITEIVSSVPGDNLLKDILVTRIPIEKQRFNDEYYIEVEQLSCSKEVFDFWIAVKKQKDGSKNIFQPSNGKIKGNIVSLTPGALPSLGIFSVSSVVRVSRRIDKSLVPYIFDPPLNRFTYDCRILFGGSNQRPDFW